MRKFVYGSILTLLTCFFVGSLMARDMQRLDAVIAPEADVKSIILNADIGLARLQVESHETGNILEGDVRYDADKFRVDIAHEQDDEIIDIFLFSEQVRRKLNLDSEDNDWQISLSQDYSWEINMEIGFAECLLDFSGLPITDLAIDIGASECEINFRDPNPQSMRILDIDAGAGELEIEGLGNANFEEMRFDGGAGDFVLNFDGEFSGFKSVRIDVGVGALRLELPRNLPVRIETDDSWLNSINFRGARLSEIGDGHFETKNYKQSNYGLEIDLDLGIGEADIIWID